jgi:hypothetical protein
MDCWVVDQLLDAIAGRNGNETTKRVLRRELDRVTAEFAGPSPSPVESVLAQTAAITWLSLRFFEAQFVGGATSEGGISLAESENHQRLIDRAHRRLLTALRTLTTVRRLVVPAAREAAADSRKRSSQRVPVDQSKPRPPV